MTRIGKHLALMSAIAMMTGGMDVIGRREVDIDTRPANPVIPKGCKEYWFNEHGSILSSYKGRPSLNSEYSFYCIAINIKSAKKKFDKWKFLNPSPSNVN